MNFQNKLNKTVFCLFLISLSFCGCKTENNQKANVADEKEVLLQSIEEFNSAFRDCEVEKLESMITNNYVHTNSNSKSIRKVDWITYLHKRKKQLASGELIINNYKMDETEIAMYDDMAIVTAKISFSSTRSGEQKENEIRVTNVWVKKGGRWKRAGFHDTRIK